MIEIHWEGLDIAKYATTHASHEGPGDLRSAMLIQPSPLAKLDTGKTFGARFDTLHASVESILYYDQTSPSYIVTYTRLDPRR